MSLEDTLTVLGQLTVTEAQHTFRYDGFVVGDVDGHPAAALSVYDPKVSGLETVGAGFAELNAKGAFDGRQRVENPKGAAAVRHCIPEEAEGAWVIESVATVPEFRRQGLIHALLERVLEEGRHRGFHLGQVSVFIGNVPAQRAYERCGFGLVDEKRHPDFETEIGCPGIARLHCRL
ncbi:MAG: GNAT family N-acetyltransferase [Chloroflexota bacterium]